MTELISGGVLERHVRRVRRLYAERLAVMREALARAFPPETGVGAPLAGNAVWVTLPPDVDADAVAAAARTAGIAYDRGDWFFLEAAPGPCLMLSFAVVPAARIAEGIERLGRIVHAHRGARQARRNVR
jgi:2-aminoadipate transaminase